MKLRYLQDKNGNKFYPIDHAKAVYDSNGKNMSDLMKEKLDIHQGVENKDKFLQVNSDGDLELVDINLDTDADHISYENDDKPELTNVKLALDNLIAKVYYVDPRINSFTSTPSTLEYEIGSVINSVQFNWSYNKEIISQSLTGCTVDVADRTVTYNTPFNTNKTFTLTASDGTKSVSSSKSFSFKNKIYWGASVIPAAYDDAFILGLANKKFATGKAGTYSMSLGNNEYGYIAFPTSFGTLSSWYIGGFETTVDHCATISFTNASGGMANYYIYKTGRPALGSISPEIR